MEYLIEEIDDLPINDDPVTLEEEQLDIIINSITSSFKIGCQIDFQKIPRKYISPFANQITATLKIGGCIITIRNSETLLCVNASSNDQALSAAKKSVEILNSWGINATFNEFKILHYSCSCLLPWRIKVEQMATKYHNDFKHEFNRCILNINKKQGYLVIYPSGFVYVTGRTIEIVLNSLERALPFVSKCRI